MTDKKMMEKVRLIKNQYGVVKKILLDEKEVKGVHSIKVDHGVNLSIPTVTIQLYTTDVEYVTEKD